METTAVKQAETRPGEQPDLTPELTPELTDAQKAFILIDRQYATVVKPFMERYREARDAVIAESGIGAYFQDDAGIVYHTAEKKGQWIDFTPHEIQRTRREGEQKGSLSLTAAREAGFIVEGQGK